MKTKIKTILVILMSFAALPLRADEPTPSHAQLELKMKQIELDVALKQFEKIETTLAEASLDARLIDSQEGSEAQANERRNKAEQKMALLSEMKNRLRQEILKKGEEIEEMRKKWGIPAIPVESVLRPARPFEDAAKR